MRHLKPRLLALLVSTCLAACGNGASSDSKETSAASQKKPASTKRALVRQQYTAGTIQPNHLSATELDQQLQDFYKQWKAGYVAQECGDGRYFVKVNADKKPVGGDTAPNTITVSEAHGYGMLISVMMADHDDQAKKIFDGMFLYFQDHPAVSDKGLMAWNQVEGCGNSGDRFRGNISATDGDLDIAYALLLADKQWGSQGSVNYLQEAQAVMQAIMKHEVHPSGNHLMIGDWAGTDGVSAIEQTTRSSDFMQSHLNAFFIKSGESRWLSVRDRTYAIMDSISQQYSPQTGLMPDFITGLNQSPRPAEAKLVGDERDGKYSWNAARYPWRIGLDYLLYGDQRASRALDIFNQWARSSTSDNPAAFADTYELDGRPLANHESNNLAFVSALGVSAMIDAKNQNWVNAIWDDMQGQSIKNGAYYENTLKLLSMIIMSGHWQRP